ncbi:E3 ubiquitin-protein ligase TRIM7-like isoform X2 [Podarcis raffonei]|uniref:E3 ubiquitin-protein ligase TRIM7-like isoform X2 n=1 Tax=Podarcis raffonei TaxID=65483 RepID=UPI0023296694|nr:E3 ubiquitin-protein ligase TRIM7-like isoform X2 [Podarcis raffonei]
MEVGGPYDVGAHAAPASTAGRCLFPLCRLEPSARRVTAVTSPGFPLASAQRLSAQPIGWRVRRKGGRRVVGVLAGRQAGRLELGWAGVMSGGVGGGMSAEQQLQQRLLRSRLRGAQHPGLAVGGPLAPPPPLLPPLPSVLSPPSPPDSPPPGTTPAEIPAGPRCPSETWCSLCRVYCPDPVCLPCGHNFCTACIGQRLGEPKINISCLECGATARKRNLRPIKPPPLLASLVADRPKRQRLDSGPGGAVALPAAPVVVAPPPLPQQHQPMTVAPAVSPAPVCAPAPPPPAAAAAAPPPPPPLLALTPPTPPSPVAPAAPAAPAADLSTSPPLPRRLSVGGCGEGAGGKLCEKHRDVLQFFCEEDQAPICAHCDRSQEHRAHAVFHVERAARDYRERVLAQLEILKQEKNTLWSQKLTGERKIQDYMETIQAERQEIISEFERLHQFLKDEEQHLLAQLEELDKEIEKRKDEMVTKLSEELSRLGDVIAEMEVKCKQPAAEFLQMYFQVPQPDLKAVEKLAWMTSFLQVHVGTHRVWLPCRPLRNSCSTRETTVPRRLPCVTRAPPTSPVLELTPDVPPLGSQDIKKTMSRCAPGHFQPSEEASPKLEERLDNFSRKGKLLKETLNRFQDNVTSVVEKGETVKTLNDKDAALYPDVPSAFLPLDRRNAGCEELQERLPALDYVPDAPKRLDSRALVLGCDGFTSGRYFWELEVGDGEFWAVGVTRDPSKKKGMMGFSPEEGIWAVGLWKGQHWALTSPVTALSLSKPPRRIRVSLDYVGECVTFTDADTDSPIFTFPPASFNGARTHPLLWVVGFPAHSVFLRHMGVKYPAGVHEMDILSP